MTRLLITLACATLLLASGAIHGVLTDRWTPRKDMLVSEARERVNDVPLKIDHWDGTAQAWDEIDSRNGDIGAVTRQYVNRFNGQAVGMLMSAGYTQNMWKWHTPLECYPGIGYQLTSKVTKLNIPVEGMKAEFFRADFTMPRGAAPVRLRVFWAWSGDGNWIASDNPKFALSAYPCLYKIYVIRYLLQADEPVENDPCVEFMKAALPEVDRVFFPGQ